MGGSQAAVTWFMFLGWVKGGGVPQRSLCKKWETCCGLSCSRTFNKLRSRFDPKKAPDGNPCHKSKGESTPTLISTACRRWHGLMLWCQVCCSMLGGKPSVGQPQACYTDQREAVKLWRFSAENHLLKWREPISEESARKRRALINLLIIWDLN